MSKCLLFCLAKHIHYESYHKNIPVGLLGCSLLWTDFNNSFSLIILHVVVGYSNCINGDNSFLRGLCFHNRHWANIKARLFQSQQFGVGNRPNVSNFGNVASEQSLELLEEQFYVYKYKISIRVKLGLWLRVLSCSVNRL